MTRTIPLDRYRNIAILAGFDAGRTTTTERILALTGLAAGENLSVEQDNEQPITLTSAATSCVWRDFRITLVQLPGADSMQVLDGAVLVLDAARGLTDELSRAERVAAAKLVFINKLDHHDAAIESVLAGIGARLSGRPVLLTLPIGSGGDFAGLIDLVEFRAAIWQNVSFGAPAQDAPVPEELREAAVRARAAIVAAIAPGTADPAPAVLRQALRDAVKTGAVVPVVCGSAFKCRGIRHLLDAIIDYLPAPSDLTVALISADGRPQRRQPSDDEPFSGLAFETIDDPHAGKLTFVRIYSGVVAKGSVMLNSVSASPEKIGAMIRVHANHTEPVEEARTGDIVALAGLEHTTTGDTLCDPAVPVVLERVPAAPRRVQH